MKPRNKGEIVQWSQKYEIQNLFFDIHSSPYLERFWAINILIYTKFGDIFLQKLHCTPAFSVLL